MSMYLVEIIKKCNEKTHISYSPTLLDNANKHNE